MPTLRLGEEEDAFLAGTENICRHFVAEAAAEAQQRGKGDSFVGVLWPEQLDSPLALTAQELVYQCMSAQVTLALGVQVSHLPADNAFFVKAASGMRGSLAWLERQWPALMKLVDSKRRAPSQTSLLEASLFCLVEHLRFRNTLDLAPYPNLVAFAQKFGERKSAKVTPYVFDVPPMTATNNKVKGGS